MPVPPPKNPGLPNFGVGMPHARSGGDALNLTSGKLENMKRRTK